MQGLSRKEKGHWAETQAKTHLLNAGLRFVEQNFSCKVGEIDLIFQDQSYLVFIEVRHRQSGAPVSAQQSIDPRKQRKIRKTAEYFLQKHPAWRQHYGRFDVICVTSEYNAHDLQWIQNAFE